MLCELPEYCAVQLIDHRHLVLTVDIFTAYCTRDTARVTLLFRL